MTVYVALFRGINVGGKHILPMQDLREILASLGCEDVSTYIQSGNAVFQSTKPAAELSQQVAAAIDTAFGFAPAVHILTQDDYESILAANPFPNAVATPKHLHVSFLVTRPESPDLETLDSLKTTTERFELHANAFYLHAPDGIGRSKLVQKVDKCLGVKTTSRNWRTTTKIAEMLRAIIS